MPVPVTNSLQEIFYSLDTERPPTPLEVARSLTAFGDLIEDAVDVLGRIYPELREVQIELTVAGVEVASLKELIFVRFFFGSESKLLEKVDQLRNTKLGKLLTNGKAISVLVGGRALRHRNTVFTSGLASGSRGDRSTLGRRNSS